MSHKEQTGQPECMFNSNDKKQANGVLEAYQ